MSMKHRYRIWGWLAVMLLFIGCRQDEIWTGDDPLRMDYLQIEGEIAGAMAEPHRIINSRCHMTPLGPVTR